MRADAEAATQLYWQAGKGASSSPGGGARRGQANGCKCVGANGGSQWLEARLCPATAAPSSLWRLQPHAPARGRSLSAFKVRTLVADFMSFGPLVRHTASATCPTARLCLKTGHGWLTCVRFSSCSTPR